MYLLEYREDGDQFPEMNVNEAISIGILVVNDDLACQNKVAEVLRHCNYEVLHTGTLYDALHAIWENKDRLDLVITNSQKLESEGIAIIGNIKQRLKLNVLLIHSDERIEPKGRLLSFSAYVLNGLSINGVNDLLVNAKRVEEHKIGAADSQQENIEKASISNAAVEANMTSSSIKDAARLNQKGKAVELYGERSEDSDDDHHKGKKPRVNWTSEMHQKFLDAIERLGYDKAVPKKIVEVMGVPGLTRENVASHLQKYRCNMRRTQDSIFGSLPCRSTRNELQGLGVLTSPSSSRLDSLQMNMPSFPTIKESKLQYLSTSKVPAFASRSERNFYTRIRGDLISGVDKLRNLVQRRDKHISSSDNSDATKFVGYRFIGNQIDYGPIKKINTDAGMSTSKRSEDQPTSYVQNCPISDQKIGVGSGSCILRQSSQLGSSASSINGAETAGITISTSQEPDLLSSYASKIENLVQPQQSGDCNDSLLDQNALLQSWDASTVATPFGDPSENASTRLSTLPPPHQDFPLPPLEAFSEQTTAAFVDDILQQHCSPPPPLPLMFQTLDEIFEQAGNDDSLMNGLRNTYDPFDIQDFDESLFSQDD